MPKGEHFKKENPRIHQVSFKVNKTELEQLQAVVKQANVSIPEWIRGQIISPTKNVAPAKVAVKVAKPKKAKVAAPVDNGVHKGEQTSMF
jgi:hypothetical protein